MNFLSGHWRLSLISGCPWSEVPVYHILFSYFKMCVWGKVKAHSLYLYNFNLKTSASDFERFPNNDSLFLSQESFLECQEEF